MVDEDVPPLEDMSALVDRVREIREKTAEKPQKLSAEIHNVESNRVEEPQPTKPKNSGFGGMRKGFLFGSKTEGKSKAPKQPVKNLQAEQVYDVIKPKTSPDGSLVFDEVQDAMKGSNVLQSKEWITDDFMKNIEGNEKLFKQLSDPKFSQAIDWMKRDPKSAMEYYKNDQDVQDFFKQFYKILGNHFTQLGDKESAKQDNQVMMSSNQATSEDNKKMQKILSDPEIQKILSKPDVQNLLELLRNEPDKAQNIFQASDFRLRADIQKLVSVGLLGVQPQ
ncbi:unnamed protein product [Clavelina lepadiformis]|uniref:STI1/HOP DP domain-containing protein n=1 Tax=Clavelina lepadiformis TaxID=159417 RepID=A0ABP0F0I1_CLALP